MTVEMTTQSAASFIKDLMAQPELLAAAAKLLAERKAGEVTVKTEDVGSSSTDPVVPAEETPATPPSTPPTSKAAGKRRAAAPKPYDPSVAAEMPQLKVSKKA